MLKITETSPLPATCFTVQPPILLYIYCLAAHLSIQATMAHHHTFQANELAGEYPKRNNRHKFLYTYLEDVRRAFPNPQWSLLTSRCFHTFQTINPGS